MQSAPFLNYSAPYLTYGALYLSFAAPFLSYASPCLSYTLHPMGKNMPIQEAFLITFKNLE
jgi:hypothetical protein